MNRLSNYFEKLKNADERTKRRFVAIASGLSMVVVIFLWVVYLNLTLPALTRGGTTGDTATSDTSIASPSVEAAPETPDNSFLGILARGLRVIGSGAGKQIETIKEDAIQQFSKIGTFATKKNETSITPNTVKFEPNTLLEAIPPTKLPE